VNIDQYIRQKEKSDIACIIGTGNSANFMIDLNPGKIVTYFLNGSIIIPWDPKLKKWKYKPDNFMCIDHDVAVPPRCKKSGNIYTVTHDGICPYCGRKNTCNPRYEYHYWKMAVESGANMILGNGIGSFERDQSRFTRFTLGSKADNYLLQRGRNPGFFYNGTTVLMPALHLMLMKSFRVVIIAGCDHSREPLVDGRISRRFWDHPDLWSREDFPWLKQADIAFGRHKSDIALTALDYRSYKDRADGKSTTRVVLQDNYYVKQWPVVMRMIRALEKEGIIVLKLGPAGSLDIPYITVEQFRKMSGVKIDPNSEPRKAGRHGTQGSACVHFDGTEHHSCKT